MLFLCKKVFLLQILLLVLFKIKTNIMKFKYYVVYKTTMEFKNNSYYYIGMHCTNNLDDGYYGSGEKLKTMFSFKETKNVKRKILAYANNKRQLMALEGFYINKQNITDEFCLNISSGLSKEKQAKLRSDNQRIIELELELENKQNIINFKNKQIQELKIKKNKEKGIKEYKKYFEELENKIQKLNDIIYCKNGEIRLIYWRLDKFIKIKNKQIQELKTIKKTPIIGRNLSKLLY